MIVEMKKIELAGRAADKEKILSAVRKMGLVHLVPFAPQSLKVPSELRQEIDNARRVFNVLNSLPEAEAAIKVKNAEEAIKTVCGQLEEIEEIEDEISRLSKDLLDVKSWGAFDIDQIREISSRLLVKFLLVPESELSFFVDQMACICGKKEGKNCVFLVSREVEMQLPEGVEEIQMPDADERDINQKISECRKNIELLRKEIAQFVSAKGIINEKIEELEANVEWSFADQGLLSTVELFGLSGWIPSKRESEFAKFSEIAGVPAAIRFIEPEENEAPPTLVERAAWVKPIESIFAILGTVPGYREFDISMPFLLFLTLFSMMLIGDAGYGLLFLVPGALFYKKLVKMVGKPGTLMLIIIGAAVTVYGALTGIFFGVEFKNAPLKLDEKSTMWLCFVIGAIHLFSARCWKAIRIFPDLRFLAELGWALAVVANLFVVFLMVLGEPMPGFVPYLLGAGVFLALFFTTPSWSPLAPLKNLMDVIMGVLSCFSDVISYVRLMAVGMASVVLAQSFNALAADLGIIWISIPILIFGHLLNIGLGGIALFAHGVRLNMLEFCNHLSMEWTGSDYTPFKTAEENKDS